VSKVNRFLSSLAVALGLTVAATAVAYAGQIGAQFP
jgi:hypothetical protein